MAGFILRLSHRLYVAPSKVTWRTGLTSYRVATGTSPVRHLLMMEPPEAAAFAHATRMSTTAAEQLNLLPYLRRYPPVAEALTRQPGDPPRARNLFPSWLLVGSTRYCPACLKGDGSKIQDDTVAPGNCSGTCTSSSPAWSTGSCSRTRARLPAPCPEPTPRGPYQARSVTNGNRTPPASMPQQHHRRENILRSPTRRQQQPHPGLPQPRVGRLAAQDPRLAQPGHSCPDRLPQVCGPAGHGFDCQRDLATPRGRDRSSRRVDGSPLMSTTPFSNGQPSPSAATHPTAPAATPASGAPNRVPRRQPPSCSRSLTPASSTPSTRCDRPRSLCWSTHRKPLIAAGASSGSLGNATFPPCSGTRLTTPSDGASPPNTHPEHPTGPPASVVQPGQGLSGQRGVTPKRPWRIGWGHYPRRERSDLEPDRVIRFQQSIRHRDAGQQGRGMFGQPVRLVLEVDHAQEPGSRRKGRTPAGSSTHARDSAKREPPGPAPARTDGPGPPVWSAAATATAYIWVPPSMRISVPVMNAPSTEPSMATTPATVSGPAKPSPRAGSSFIMMS